MITINGTCKYCGQIRMVHVSEGKKYTQEEIDKIAESECDCALATNMRARVEAYGSLEGMLAERFPDDDIDERTSHIKEMLRAAGKEMSELYIDAISFTAGKEKYSLSINQKLNFKLKISRTETEVQEA